MAILLATAASSFRKIPSLDNAAYASLSLSVSAQDSGQRDISFKPDGSKMYVLGLVNDSVFQYTLSTLWAIDTASYDGVSFSVNSQEATPHGLFIKPDGTAMYVMGQTNDTVYQYSLSTPWDISTASYSSKSFAVSSQTGTPYSVEFNIAGTKMYVTEGASGGETFQYSLSTAWDVSTASYDSISYDAVTQVTAALCARISFDGKKFFVLDGADALYQYSLSTAYDISTASYDSLSITLTTQDGSPASVFLKPQGDGFYMIGDANDTVYQYSL